MTYLKKLYYDQHGDIIVSAVLIVLLVLVAVMSFSICGYVDTKLAVANAVRVGERIAESDGYISTRTIAKIQESLIADNIDISSLNISGTSTAQNYGDDCFMIITLTYQVKIIDNTNTPSLLTVTITENAYFQSEKVIR